MGPVAAESWESVEGGHRCCDIVSFDLERLGWALEARSSDRLREGGREGLQLTLQKPRFLQPPLWSRPPSGPGSLASTLGLSLEPCLSAQWVASLRPLGQAYTLLRAGEKQEGLEPRWAVCPLCWVGPAGTGPVQHRRDSCPSLQEKHLVSDERTGWDSLGCVTPRAPSDHLSLGLRCPPGRWLV